ncbi:MAG: dihydroneopterin aldolase [bacterium]
MPFSQKPTDFIHIRQLKVDCIIGIYPKELKKEQPVVIDARIGMDLSRAGRTGKIGYTCDYELIANEISILLKFRRYRLLEAAAEEIASMLFGVHKMVESLELSLEKPQALPGLAQGAAIEISRNRRDYPVRNESASFGEVDVLLETKDAGMYLLHIHQDKEIPLHYHRIMRELEWRVQGDILRNDKKIQKLSPVEWAFEQKHSYRNIGKKTATLFWCDVPAFNREDEIVVSKDSRPGST